MELCQKGLSLERLLTWQSSLASKAFSHHLEPEKRGTSILLSSPATSQGCGVAPAWDTGTDVS